MDKQLRKSYRDDQREYIHQRNMTCTDALLKAILKHHAPEIPEPVYVEVLPQIPLPPIPNAEIAKAAEAPFPKYLNRISEIQHLVLKEFPKITIHELKSARRKKHLVLARHIGMYVAKRFTDKSYPEIGRRYGGRDHSSVIFAVRKIEDLVRTNAEVAAIVNRIEDAMQVHEE